MNCGVPSPPTNGSVGNYLHTRKGATVTYQCDDGYIPSTVMTAMCTDTTKWVPLPEIHDCVLFVAGIQLLS